MGQSPPLTTGQIARRALRGAAYQGFAQYTMVGIGIAKTAILFRLIDPAIYGVVGLATAYASFLSVLRVDLRPVVIADPHQNAARLATQYILELMSTGVGLIIAAAAAVIVPQMCSSACWQAIFILLGIAVAQSLTSTPLYILERELRQDVLSKLRVLSAALGMAISVALAYFGLPLLAVLSDTAMLMLVPGIGAWLVTRWRPVFVWDEAVARDTVSFSATLWMSSLLGMITFEFDDWLVGTFRGERELGFYSQAYARAKIPLDVVGGVIASMSMALYSQSGAAGQEVLARAYRLTTWILARVIALSSVVMLGAAEEIVTLWLGPTWLPIVPLIRLMFLYILGRPLFQNHGILLTALRHEKQWNRIVLVQAVFLLIAGPVAVLGWGAAGMSVAVSLMMLLGLAISERAAQQLTGINALPIYALPAAMTLILTPLLYGVGQVAHVGLLMTLIFKGGLALAVFAAVTLLFERQPFGEVMALMLEHLGRRATAGE